MNGQMSELLETMRERLAVEVEGEEAHGPDSEAGAHGDSGEAGEHGAENTTDALVAFNLYFDGIVEGLLAEYELSADEAEDFMFGVIRDMVAAGTIPDLPEDDDDAEALAQWLGAAKSAGVEARVLAVAEESAAS